MVASGGALGIGPPASSSSSPPPALLEWPSGPSESEWKPPATRAGSARKRRRAATDYPLNPLSSDVYEQLALMYSCGVTDKSKKLDPPLALQYLNLHGTKAHAESFGHLSHFMPPPPINPDDKPTFGVLELPNLKVIKSLFGGTLSALQKSARESPALAELRALPSIYPGEKDNDQVFWTVVYDDGDVEGMNGAQLKAALQEWSQHETNVNRQSPGKRAATNDVPEVYPPSGRGDIFRRVVKNFSGAAYVPRFCCGLHEWPADKEGEDRGRGCHSQRWWSGPGAWRCRDQWPRARGWARARARQGHASPIVTEIVALHARCLSLCVCVCAYLRVCFFTHEGRTWRARRRLGRCGRSWLVWHLLLYAWLYVPSRQSRCKLAKFA